jgi:hypothetical protein
MKQLSKYLFLAMLTFAAFSCKKDEDKPATPTITSFTPASAPVGTDVTITGTNFSTTPTSNTVKFNNVDASVKSATASQIVVTVPATATTGKITVTVGGVTSTSATDFTISATVKTVVEVNDDIAANTNWTADKIYLLKKFIYIKSGAILTIAPGTVIKGDKLGLGTLIVSPGGKLMAEGTAAQPIVFTSNQAKGARKYGDWGGVVLAGNAPINQPIGVPMEGGITGSYGGTNAADNSGSLKYVRIEFAGIALSTKDNSEINGLTMYGVGNGTTIDYVQVSYSGDDSYEWFGGTVNAKHLIAYRGWDDDFDTDFGYRGNVQYAVSLRDPQYADQSKSNGFESDNWGTGTVTATQGDPLTAPVFANVSIFVTKDAPLSTTQSGSGAFQAGMHIRRNTSISIFNSLLVGYPEGLRLDGQLTYANATAGTLQLRGIVLANMTTPIISARGTGETSPTDDEAKTFFNTAAFSNQIVAGADLATLALNANSFNLATPNFLPNTGSPLLTGAIWTDKGADAFFTKETFRGAFGTTNWAATWTNFDPQNTDY